MTSAQTPRILPTRTRRQDHEPPGDIWVGMIFGFRPAGSRDWKFYMQVNVTIQYCTVERIVETIKK